MVLLLGRRLPRFGAAQIISRWPPIAAQGSGVPTGGRDRAAEIIWRQNGEAIEGARQLDYAAVGEAHERHYRVGLWGWTKSAKGIRAKNSSGSRAPCSSGKRGYKFPQFQPQPNFIWWWAFSLILAFSRPISWKETSAKVWVWITNSKGKGRWVKLIGD